MDELASWRLTQAESLLASGQVSEAIAYAKEAYREAQQDGAEVPSCWAAALLARIHYHLEHLEETADWAERVLRGPVNDDTVGAHCVSAMMLAGVRAQQDRVDDAIRAMVEGQRHLSEPLSVRERAQSHGALGRFYQRLGLIEPAYDAYVTALGALTGNEGVSPMARMALMVSMLEACLDLYRDRRVLEPALAAMLMDDTLPLLKPLATLARELGYPHAQAHVAYIEAAYAALQDWPADAQARLEAAQDQWTELPRLAQIDWWLLSLEISQALGASEGAQQGIRSRIERLIPHVGRSLPVPELMRCVRWARLKGDDQQALQLMRTLHSRALMHAQAVLTAKLAAAAEQQGGLQLQAERQDTRRQHQELHDHQSALSSMALTDALTQLSNRHALQQTHEVLRHLHGEHVLVLMDIDHFKQVNDGYSHLIGDQVLLNMGALLRRSARSRDVAARYGGEEFALLLVGTTLDGARQVVQRLQQLVREAPWDTLVPGRTIRLSGGAVRMRRWEALESAMARADSLLYRAKASGRNRFCFEDGGISLFGELDGS